MAIYPGLIGFDGEILFNLNAVLMQRHDGLPTREEASRVYGASDEHATAAFMQRLTKVADQLGDHTNVVRVTVKDHVEIMRDAASSMQDHDEHNAAWVKEQDAMFTDTAKSTTQKDVADAQETVQTDAESQGQTTEAGATSTSNTGDM
ncbi:hypothetical protein PU630_13595 [Microbacterium horticulturae]|uniref:Uncharacterized protein n=1 Tax=Microbacterium horticulturae TaxID=3028316 RepID=A0ABY8BVP7_9MICO|nr:hypothetical protein [Microbacterium sp. KACC 23027]WEG08261.1 hypothetical protein PU630_13595 [Microbacterium sp. KACC 23027]